MTRETSYLLAGIGIGTGLGVVVVVTMLTWSPQMTDGRQGEVAERLEGSQAFDFEISDINPNSPTHDQNVKLSRLYPVRGVLVNFMASWCAPCLAELPYLEEIQASGITRVVYVAASEMDGKEDLVAMAGKLDLTLPLLYVSPEQAEVIHRNYDAGIIPCSYLVDGSGVIRKVIVGARSKEALEREIRESLGAPSLARLKRNLEEGE